MTTATPSRKRTPKPVQPVLLRRRADGQVEALSSDGRCKHVAAAIQRYATFWTPPSSFGRRPVCDDCGSPLDRFGGCPCDGPAVA
jgi:hypothetical protein